ncbi:MAG TPA: bifunctional enoyl-CoA hydratase/phosphate acetyltransferase [Steroidobacteraceae bacterium]|nr:bifunctional enoyl-CoA hydratase/phosphate acetyltransferase [Steroidobacteraceae bacterium]
MQFIENRTFDELHIGDAAECKRTLRSEDVAQAAGDGIAELLSTELPGPGTRYLDLSLHFRGSASVADTVTVRVRVRDMVPQTKQVTLSCECVAASGELLLEGQARVIAPAIKLRRPRAVPADAALFPTGTRYRQLLDAARQFSPIRTAVVHPCDAASLTGAMEALAAGLIIPVLIGPAAKILKAAADAGRDIKDVEIIDVPHSHAAAERAVALGREAKIEALMKGALHTDELMAAAVREAGGLRTERRMSHVFALEVPHYPKPLFLTDAAVNIAPDLEVKRDIVQNAIDLVRALGVPTPKVAILSAIETVSGKIPSTIDAAALCKMAERQQIRGGLLDGPLAFDNAISSEAARTKGILSPVAGCVDILVVPDLEAGNMLVKQLIYLAGAQAAGIVLGARLPIILTSRADGDAARLASCALAQLMVRRQNT